MASQIPDNIMAIINALRTPAAGHTVTPQTGPRTGTPISVGNPHLGPIEQRRDGYRQYLQEFRAGSQEGEPLSYEEWIAQEE